MKMSVYAIRDVQSGFLRPTVEQSDGVAIRNFSNAILSNPSGLFQNFSKDYDFYRIGEYDTDSGSITPINPIEFLISADSVVFSNERRKANNNET